MEYKQTQTQNQLSIDYKEFIKYTNQAISVFGNDFLDEKPESLFTFNMLIQSAGANSEIEKKMEEENARKECEEEIKKKKPIIEDFIIKNGHPSMYQKTKRKEFYKMIKDIESKIDSCKIIKTGYMKNLIKIICKTNDLVSKKKKNLMINITIKLFMLFY